MSSEVEVKPAETPVIATTAAVTEPENVHDSEEYESAEEIEEGERYDEEGEVEEIEIEVEEEEEVEDEEEEEDDEDEVEEGQGRDKPLDDDEDRKNPQFIPKKGYFYEHDDRMNADDGDDVDGEPKVEEKPRKTSNVITDRWTHDMFDEGDQAPKTQDELSSRYGYDIRSDDMAPRARRRRRYGRGPNTYTRKWEEEEAYQRPRGAPRGRGTRGGRPNYKDSRPEESGGYEQDFPELGNRSRGTTQARRASADGEENKPPRPTQQTPRPRNRNSEEVSNNKSVAEEEYRDRGDRDRGYNRRGGRGDGRISYRRPDWDMRDDRGDEGGYSDYRDRGQSRGGYRGGRSRGRRSEFRNRNIYPERRGSGPEPPAEPEDEETAWERKVEEIRKIDTAEQQRKVTPGPTRAAPNIKSTEFAPPASQANKSNSTVKKLPFTNTEYTGSASLTAQRNYGTQGNSSNRNQDDYEDSSARGNQVAFQHESDQVNVKLVNSNQSNTDQTETENKDFKSARRPLQQQAFTNDKPRNQIPPRLQQQQQQHEHQQQQQQHQQQQQQAESAKPKRFSTQRQRQDPSVGVAQAPVVSATPQQVQMGQGPVPTQMVPTPIPVSVMSGYPPQAYYEQVGPGYEPQYEGSGSPIPIAVSGAGHGPSVSPSMWGPAGYNAPYASPPTGPQIPPAPYGDPSFMAPAQPQPIFAPPPYPHPQFIQDPTIINYPPPGPPSFGPPFHAQAFQGYAQMTPGPPELYHAGGVTYYSTQNQLQRPHIMVPTKHPKDSSKRDLRSSLRHHQDEAEMYHQYREIPSDVDPQLVIEVSAADTESYSTSELKRTAPDTDDLGQRFEDALQLQPTEQRIRKSPSPAPIEIKESPSWSDQMAELTPVNSPLQSESPFDLAIDKPKSTGAPTQEK